MTGADIFFRLSEGSNNDSPFASIGGAMSFLFIESGTLGNVMRNVSVAEAAAGITDYCCIYIFNDHDTDTAFSTIVSLLTAPSSPSCTIQLGDDPSGPGGTAATIANRLTAPSGVTFVSTPVSLGNLGPQQGAALWLKRIVTAGASVLQEDNFVLSVSAEET